MLSMGPCLRRDDVENFGDVLDAVASEMLRSVFDGEIPKK
jgi:hypothetical protein